MDENDHQPDGLDSNFRDKLVAIGKGAAGVIPLAGGLIAEVVGVAIPEQRADRIASYLRSLADRVDALAEDIKAELASNAEKIDLIEEGGFQSARATSPERIAQIVEAVSRGLSEDDIEVVRRKRLLLVLGELDDDEINLLNAYGRSYAGADREAFKNVRRPDLPHFQSPPSVIEQTQLYEAGKAHLTRLGLLKKNYGNVKKGEMPDFDSRAGDFKHSLEVSHLGRMLLREIGLETPFDAQQKDR